VALKINVRDVDGVGVVGLEGRIVLGEESNALREQVKGMLAAGKKKIVLNMDNVTYIDSAGLGALVAAHHSARTQGASLKLSQLRRLGVCGEITRDGRWSCRSKALDKNPSTFEGAPRRPAPFS